MGAQGTNLHVGVEIDHLTVRAVAVQDGTVAWVRTVQHENLAEALAAAIAETRPQDRVRLVLPTLKVTLTPLDLATPARTFAELENAIRRATTDAYGGTACALIPRRTAQGAFHGRGVAVSAPADLVETTYGQVPRARVQMLPSPAATGQLAGVSLAVRWSGTELLLVRDSMPTRHRQLPVGGLADLEASLGGAANGAKSRVLDALAGNGIDPIATAALDQFLSALTRQVDSTLESWTRAGHRFERSVSLHGSGAHAPALAAKLTRLNLTVTRWAQQHEALATLPTGERDGYVTAYLAACLDEDLLPAAAFPDPRARSHAREAVLTRRRKRRTLALAGAAVAVAVSATLPQALGAWAQHSADSHLSQAAAPSRHGETTGPLAILTRDQSRAALERERAWAGALTDVLGQLRAPLRLERVEPQADGPALAVLLEGSGDGTPAQVSEAAASFASRAKDASGIQEANLTRMWAVPGGAHFEIRLTMTPRTTP